MSNIQERPEDIIRTGSVSDIVKLATKDANFVEVHWPYIFMVRPDAVRELYHQNLISNDIIIDSFFSKYHRKMSKSYIPEMFENEKLIQYIIDNLDEFVKKNLSLLGYLAPEVFERKDFQEALQTLTNSNRKKVLEKINPEAKTPKPELSGTINQGVLSSGTVQEIQSTITSENRTKSIFFLLEYRLQMFLKLCQSGQVVASDILALIPHINSSQITNIPSKFFQEQEVLEYILNNLEYIARERDFVFEYLPIDFFCVERITTFVIDNFQNLLRNQSYLLRFMPAATYENSRFISKLDEPNFLEIFLQYSTTPLMLKMPSELVCHQKFQDYLMANIEYVLTQKLFLLRFVPESFLRNEQLFGKEENVQLFLEAISSTSIGDFPQVVFQNENVLNYIIKNLDYVLENKMFILSYLPLEFLKGEELTTQLINLIKGGKCDIASLPRILLLNLSLAQQLLVIVTPDKYSIFPKEILTDPQFVMQALNYISADCYDLLPKELSNNNLVQEKCGKTKQIYTRQVESTSSRGKNSFDGQVGVYPATSVYHWYPPLEDEESEVTQSSEPYIRGKDGFVRVDKDGYDEEWRDEEGNLISFFTLEGNFPIQGKSDYYKIYKEYINSKLSVPLFCKIYGISSVEGFNKLLERIQAESLIEKRNIDKHKATSASKFWAKLNRLMRQLLSGELSFEKFLNSDLDFNFAKINTLFQCCSEDERLKLQMIVFDYVESCGNIFSSNFIKSLTFDGKTPFDSYSEFVLAHTDLKYGEQARRHLQRLEKVNEHFKRASLYMKVMKNDKVCEVDDFVIDQAYVYLRDNGIHINQASLITYAKKIALGEIDYTSRLTAEKAKLIASIQTLVQNEKEMKDYISLMRKNSTNRI